MTESAFEQIKVQLGFQDMSLQEIEQKVLERTAMSEATDVAGSGMGELRNPPHESSACSNLCDCR